MKFAEATLPKAPEGFTASWTPGNVTTLWAGMTCGGPEGGKVITRPRPAECIRITCDLCGTYWDGAVSLANIPTFRGAGHQRLCRKRPMSVVRENVARMVEEIYAEDGWAAADYLFARELDYAASEHGEHLMTYEMFMGLLKTRVAKLERNRPR
jgi:hypothetical protein